MSTPNCTVEFWEDSDRKGDNRTFSGPTSVSQMSKEHYDGTSGTFNEMDDSVNSLSTGSQAWVTLYSDNNFTGSSVSYGPNSNIDDLGSMKNNMASFKLFDAAPVDIQKVQNNFFALYPGSTDLRDPNSMVLEGLNYYQQDASYTVYVPTITQDPVSGNVSFSVNMEHHNTLGERDRATAAFSMDNKGNFLTSISVTYDMGNGAYQVPNWMIKIIDAGIDEAEDAAIEFADGAEIVLTAGVGTELVIPTDILIMGAADVLTAAVDHINNVITKLFGLSDNGGTMYFASSISHAIARLMYSYYQERGAASSPLVSFDQAGFQRALGTTWDDSEHKSNPCMLFSNGGSTYRCYYPDNTSGYNRSGLLSSVKIDAVNDNDQDDHLILLATFDPQGHLFSVQGSIDICGAPDDSDDDDNYVAPASGTLAYDKNKNIILVTKDTSTVLTGYSNLTDAYRDKMQTALNNVQYVDHGNFSAALKNLVNASVFVVQSIDTAVS